MMYLRNDIRCVLCVLAAADGCLENAPDTAEFSREFQKHQHLFDPEHDYPALAKWVSTELERKVLYIPINRIISG